MFEHRSHVFGFCRFTVVACVAALSGCGMDGSSTSPDASVAAAAVPSTSSAPATTSSSLPPTSTSTPPTAAIPSVPTGLTAIATDMLVTLQWTATSGASSYEVKRATTSGGPYAQVATVQGTAYTDSSVSNNTEYFYVVSAVNSTGASANSAEVGATPNAPPTAVASGTLPTVTCTNLGTPGTWQNVTPPVFDPVNYPPGDFVVDDNTGLVYIGTNSYDDGNSKGVQRSADCGNSWVHVSTGNGSDAVNGGRQWTFQINSLDGRIMYTNSGYYQTGLWKSYDGGVDWTNVTPTVGNPPGDVGNLQMDPQDPQHLLVTWHDPCYGVNDQYVWSDQVGCFHESKDGGLTWTAHYSTDGTNWPSQVRVLLLHDSTWIVLADSTLYTNDGGQTFTVVSSSSLGGHSSGTLSRANNGAYFIGTEFGAYYSPPASGGQNWTLVGGEWVGAIADTGSLLYETQQNSVLQTSPSTDGVNWQPVSGGPSNCEEAHYDVVHKLLYVGCGANGLWRLTTQ
jgi:hypothetical protein